MPRSRPSSSGRKTTSILRTNSSKRRSTGRKIGCASVPPVWTSRQRFSTASAISATAFSSPNASFRAVPAFFSSSRTPDDQVIARHKRLRKKLLTSDAPSRVAGM
jgi:hypothetical protein